MVYHDFLSFLNIWHARFCVRAEPKLSWIIRVWCFSISGLGTARCVGGGTFIDLWWVGHELLLNAHKLFASLTMAAPHNYISQNESYSLYFLGAQRDLGQSLTQNGRLFRVYDYMCLLCLNYIVKQYLSTEWKYSTYPTKTFCFISHVF